MFSVQLFAADDERIKIVKSIRKDVFVLELGVDENEEFDCFDEYGAPTLFALLSVDDIPCGTGRLTLTDNGYKIGRIALLKSARCGGYGSAMVKTLLTKAFSVGAECVLVDARVEAVKFYEKIGFVINGDLFNERGMEHLPMKLEKKELCSCGG